MSHRPGREAGRKQFRVPHLFAPSPRSACRPAIRTARPSPLPFLYSGTILIALQSCLAGHDRAPRSTVSRAWEIRPAQFPGEYDGRNETSIEKRTPAPNRRYRESLRACSVPQQHSRRNSHPTMLSSGNRCNLLKTKDRCTGYPTIFPGGQSLFSNLQSQILLLRAGKRVSIKTRCFSLQLIRNKRRRPATSGNFSRVLFRGLRCEDEPRTCDGISANPCRQRAVAARPFCRGSCDCPGRGPA